MRGKEQLITIPSLKMGYIGTVAVYDSDLLIINCGEGAKVYVRMGPGMIVTEGEFVTAPPGIDSGQERFMEWAAEQLNKAPVFSSESHAEGRTGDGEGEGTDDTGERI